MFDLFAEVAVRLPPQKTFTYLVPPELVEDFRIGIRVKVPFRGREEEGVVMETHRQPPEYKTLPLTARIDAEAIVSATQMELARWMSDFYLAGIGECVYKMFPQARRMPKPKKVKKRSPPAPTEHGLNEEQQAVFERVRFDEPAAAKGAERGKFPGAHLVHGITGSGKTEVYIHLILEALARGRGAILLVPEISLTVQLIERLKQVFRDELALLHSALKKSERFAAYMALLRGEKRIAVGTRSAIFAPVINPGLIIMDEEHDGSYKEHSAPRYHARQVAFRRAETEGAALVFGSATPSLETMYNADRGDSNFEYHRLNRRATGAALPGVHLVKVPSSDIPVSGTLLRELEQNLKRGEQTLLLLNRRGYYPYLYCSRCDSAIECPNCAVTLNLHRDGRLVCHYCGYVRRDDGHCNRCGGPVSRRGSGTQKLEEFLFNLYPDMRLERLDTDSAGRREVIQTTINKLLNRELDVLVGTQMIAKGLDAPGVTLVGVLQADLGLHMPDFRAAERTFGLLTQVAGRAGRGDLAGRVYFEVANPENRIVRLASRQDYGAFYKEEIENRRQALYPPFCRLVRLLHRSESETSAQNSAEKLAALLHQALAKIRDDSLHILGPAPAPLARLHNQFRFHVLLKTRAPGEVRGVLRSILDDMRSLTARDAHLEIDFDPVDLL